METIKEGLATIKIERAKIVSKDMDVFYNPIMSFNRDISVLLLNSAKNTSMQICDPLAASGIRSIRFLKELDKGKIERIFINDHDKKSVELIKSNILLNKIKDKNKIKISNLDANFFLLDSKGFDYIDIDPFGTPNPFLDAAARRISREGILAVTATDTSALCGTFSDACFRKYWARPKKGPIMHEIGLRILIRKVQLIAAQFEKALVPIFSYSKEHYMRIFFANTKGKKEADKILSQHGMLDEAGPIWLGKLWDSKLCNNMLFNAKKSKIFGHSNEMIKFLETIKEESKISSVGFFDIHEICSKQKTSTIPRKEELINKLKKAGFLASATHFKGEAIRSNATKKQLVKILKVP